MYKLFPDKDVQCTSINIPCRNNRQMPSLVVSPKLPKKNAPEYCGYTKAGRDGKNFGILNFV